MTPTMPLTSMDAPDLPAPDSDRPLEDDQLEPVTGAGFVEDLMDWLGYPDPDAPTGDDL